MEKMTQAAAKEMANNFKRAVKNQFQCGHSRSRKAMFTEMGIELSGFRRMLADPEKLAAALEQARHDNEQPFAFPKGLTLSIDHQIKQVAGLPLVVLTPENVSRQVIVYLCGGAYFQRPQKTHWEFLERLANATHAKVVAPILPLAPAYTVRDAEKALTTYYEQLYSKHPTSNVILMGDSSGAGLATAFCEFLGQRNQPQPGSLVLFSPWLDIDLANPLVDKFADHDVMLDPVGLRTIGKLWAGDIDHHDFRVSPLYGDVAALRNVLIFVGTDEIMNPDAMAFTEKLRTAGVRAECKIGRGMYHTYPLYPTPESDEAIQLIIDRCLRE
jgi:acetyl esterase/lipase